MRSKIYKDIDNKNVGNIFLKSESFESQLLPFFSFQHQMSLKQNATEFEERVKNLY